MKLTERMQEALSYRITYDHLDNYFEIQLL